MRHSCLFSCKKLVAARKQLSIRKAPNILVIQLKVVGYGISSNFLILVFVAVIVVA